MLVDKVDVPQCALSSNSITTYIIMSALVDEALFIKRPDDTSKAETLNLDSASLKASTNAELLDLTYHLLRSTNPSRDEALTLWELRLVLLMFESQLGAAKKEALNLNNALYLLENPNAPPPQTPPKPPLGRADSTASRRSGSPAVQAAPGIIYPLPKNNDGAIGFLLLLLILRLKLAPNLSLVNELYKLCYQLRLKGSPGEEAEIQRNLVSLSYEIIMVLTITRNFYTLLSFLKSLEADLAARQDKSSKEYRHYASNVSLMIVLAHMLVLQSEDASRLDRDDLRQRYTNLDNFTVECFVNVLKTYSPMVSDGLAPSIGPDEEVTFERIIELVKDGKLTGRITCCTLASFQLGNLLEAEFESVDGSKRLVAKAEPNVTRLGDLHSKVMSQWGNYIQKVYGIE